MLKVGGDVRIIDRRLPQLPALLSRCHLGVIASVGSETVSRSLLEYFACGLPAVATDVGGVRDVVANGETGLLAASKNAGDFADKLIMLHKDEKKRSAFGMRGRQIAAERYSKQRVVKDIEALYEECLAGNR